MKNLPIFFIYVVVVLATSCEEKINDQFHVVNPHCEYLREAVTVKEAPRFGWEIASEQKGQRQTAWQVIVGDDLQALERGVGDIWNSGKRSGNATFGITWEGVALEAFRKYYWRVRAWDRDGNISRWTETSAFMTGALQPDDWKAQWIGDHPEPPLQYPLLYKHIGYLSAYADHAEKEKWVIVDLGKPQDFTSILLYPAYNNIRQIRDYYFPNAYRIEVSEVGEAWRSLVTIPRASLPQGRPVRHDVEGRGVRYVRFVATGLRRYDHRNHDPEDHGDKTKMYAFSLAELEVLRGEQNLSLNCKVTYKDALIKIDREDGYDPDMLTDGITDTPAHPERRPIPPSPLLRKTTVLRDKPVRAIACVSALGLYEIAFNGLAADHRVLAPEWTDYHKRVQYQVFDVTGLLDAGTNVISAQLADGWYAGMLGPVRWSPYFPKRGAYGLDRRLFFQMEVEYPDGQKEMIVSDGSWKMHTDGPMRTADNFLGESYDARVEVPGWQSAEFDDSDWASVFVDRNTHAHLVPQINQPIRVVETLPARSVVCTEAGHFIFDVGENIAGWCRIYLEGKPGDLIVLRHGELLDEAGALYTENLGMAVQTDSVVLGAGGKLWYEPRFTYHGFRYVEVSGLRSTPDPGILEAKVVASDQPRTGYFACSNPLLIQLYKNINRSHVSNMHSVPTDCPQRDERCGWMGDAFIFAQTSIYNRNMAAFYNKWMVDIMDAQSERGTFPDIAPHPFAYEKHFTNAPGWADAALQLPHILYLNYGDREIVENHFDAYARYIDNIRETNPDLIWKRGLGLNYGDWLNGNTLHAEGFPKTGAQVPSEVFSTIMFYNSVTNLSKMAAVTGKEEKATHYAQLAADIKEAFARHFVEENGRIEGDAQACYALALHYGIFPEALEEKMAGRMIEKFIPYKGRLNTGFHSTLPLMKELAKRGYTEKAYQLLETTEFPSWGYSIEQGATSIWERWDGYVKGRGFQGAGMNSFNHYAFGAVGEWMYQNILGIQPDPESPGFRHFVLRPLPGGTLSWAEGRYQSISGMIEAKWKKADGQFTYAVTIPANTTATVYMPGKEGEPVLVDGKPAHSLAEAGNIAFEGGYSIFEMQSGTYTLTSTL